MTECCSSLFTVQATQKTKGELKINTTQGGGWIHLGLPELEMLSDSDSFLGSEHHFLADCVW